MIKNERIVQTVKYFKYLLKARHTNGHGIHSPFVFDLVTHALFDRTKYPEYDQMKSIRSNLINNKEVLVLNGYGAGSRIFSENSRTVADLVKISSVGPKFQRLLFRLAKYYQSDVILELGTSVGLSTLAFSLGSPQSKVITIEAEPSLCEFAIKQFDRLGKTNIQVRHGMFEEQLPVVLNEFAVPGIVFIDGDHTCESTLKYFRKLRSVMKMGIIILDDINWSEGMLEAWEIIRNESEVTIDLFFMGMVIIRPHVTPGHYRIRF